MGNQEVVVKNLGPQLSRMPGLAGMTLLAGGDVALIYNPVALAALYGATARSVTQAASADGVTQAAVVEAPLAPLVLVVDDSLTVRRVTERMLLREGYRVTLAKDGIDHGIALERSCSRHVVLHHGHRVVAIQHQSGGGQIHRSRGPRRVQ